MCIRIQRYICLVEAIWCPKYAREADSSVIRGKLPEIGAPVVCGLGFGAYYA